MQGVMDKLRKQQSLEFPAKSDAVLPTTSALERENQIKENVSAQSAVTEQKGKDAAKDSPTGTGAIKKQKSIEFMLNGVSEQHAELQPATANNSSAERRSVDGELLALRQKVEILKLEKEILELQTRETPTHKLKPKLAFEDMADFVAHLDGISIEDILKFINLKGMSSSTSRLSSASNDQPIFDDRWPSLSRKSSHSLSRPEIYQLLRKRQKQPSESVRQYILDMEALAYRSDLAEYELVTFILNGLEGHISDYALFGNAKTITELKEAANILEYRATLRRHSIGCAFFNRRSKGHINNRCYNCSRFGHVKSECPYEERPKGACFKCWKPDHDSKACENPKYVQKLKYMDSASECAAKDKDKRESVGETVNDICPDQSTQAE